MFKKKLVSLSAKKVVPQNVAIFDRMINSEPIKQFLTNTGNKYTSSKVIDALEKQFSSYGNKDTLDAAIKQTTKVFIRNKREEQARNIGKQTTWNLLRTEQQKAYQLVEKESKP